MAYDLWQSCIQSGSECASWVQAVGSIGAILVAVWISARQVTAARRMEDEKRCRVDLLKTGVLRNLFEEAKSLSARLEHADDETRDVPVDEIVGGLTRIAELIREVPPFEAPDALLAIAVLEAPRTLAKLCLAAEACRATWLNISPDKPPERAEQFPAKEEFPWVHQSAMRVLNDALKDAEVLTNHLNSFIPEEGDGVYGRWQRKRLQLRKVVRLATDAILQRQARGR